jgi:hypothetical protein
MKTTRFAFLLSLVAFTISIVAVVLCLVIGPAHAQVRWPILPPLPPMAPMPVMCTTMCTGNFCTTTCS